jgi:hypothetical protein
MAAGSIAYRFDSYQIGGAWLAGLPTYLETPGMDTDYDAINLERVRLLIDGQPLPTLPAGAFAARSSRSRGAPRAG